jgi:hypothetical protein
LLARLEPQEYGLSGLVTDADLSDFQPPAVALDVEISASWDAGKLPLVGVSARPQADLPGALGILATERPRMAGFRRRI